MRRAAVIVSVLLGLVVAAGIGGLIVLDNADLAGPASRYLTRKAGRPVELASLRVSVRPGRWLRVEVQDLRLANVPGGSTPEMAALRHAAAEIDLFSLLSGPMLVRSLRLDGLRIVLERDAAGVGNWQSAAAAPPEPSAPNDPGGRAGFPTLLDAALHEGFVSYRTTGGALLRGDLTDIAIQAEGSDRPIRITGDGAYNGIAVTLRATTAPFAELHKPAVPLRMDLTLATPESGLAFKGTATDPLHLDGLDGALDLDAGRLGEVLAIFQLRTTADLPMRFSGKLLRTGDLWRLLDASGALSTAQFSGALELTEGKRVAPKRVEADRLSLQLAFDKLDANELMARTGQAGGKSHDTEALPVIDKDPGVVGETRLSAKRLVYKRTEVTDAAVHGTLAPGRVTLDDARFTLAGAKAEFSVAMEPGNPGTHISGTARLGGAEIAPLAKQLGISRPPLDGRLSAQATLSMTGLTLPEALRGSREAAVLSMSAGTVSRELVQMAAVDLRSLFGGGKASAHISCLLAVADLRGFAGTVAPIRLATSEGTVEGFGTIDLLHNSLDVTIRTEPSTTGSLALDIPIRIHGSFESPSVRPAIGAFSRASLLDASVLRQLSPDLQRAASASRCLR